MTLDVKRSACIRCGRTTHKCILRNCDTTRNGWHHDVIRVDDDHMPVLPR